MSGASPEAQKRRVLALVLPDLLVELALRQRLAMADVPQLSHGPLGVILVDEPARPEPQQLSLSGDPIALVDVMCEGGALEVGSTLVLVSNTKMLSMWEGVFYVLTRS